MPKHTDRDKVQNALAPSVLLYLVSLQGNYFGIVIVEALEQAAQLLEGIPWRWPKAAVSTRSPSSTYLLRDRAPGGQSWKGECVRRCMMGWYWAHSQC